MIIRYHTLDKNEVTHRAVSVALFMGKKLKRSASLLGLDRHTTRRLILKHRVFWPHPPWWRPEQVYIHTAGTPAFEVDSYRLEDVLHGLARAACSGASTIAEVANRLNVGRTCAVNLINRFSVRPSPDLASPVFRSSPTCSLCSCTHDRETLGSRSCIDRALDRIARLEGHLKEIESNLDPDGFPLTS